MAFQEVVALVGHIGSLRTLSVTNRIKVDRSKDLARSTFIKPVALDILVEVLFVAIAYGTFWSTCRTDNDNMICT